MISYEAYGDTVLAQIDAKKTKTEAGIIIPDTNKILISWSTVISVGPGVKGTIRVGDRILWRDSSTISRNGGVLMTDSAVFVDQHEGICSVPERIIICRKPSGEHS